MAGLRFRTVKEGDPLSAKEWNKLTTSVTSLQQLGNTQDTIQTSAGTFIRSHPQRVVEKFLLGANLTRTTQADASLVFYDGTNWVDSGDDAVSIDGEFARGFFFSGDLIRAEWDPQAGVWYAMGSGLFLIHGEILAELADGGSVTMDVFSGNKDASGITVTVHEVLGLDDSMDSATNIAAGWDEYEQKWIAHAAECGATSAVSSM